MLEYERINVSDGIDVNMSDKSKELGPYIYDGCYNMMQKCSKLKNIAIVLVKKSVERICFLYMSKREAKKLMTNSNLIDKKGALQKIGLFFFII